MRKCLIVNADDFGLSHGVNQGIIKAHEDGVVTSASLMVRWPAAAEAAAYAGKHAELSLGLHIDLGEWAYRDEACVTLYEVVPGDDTAAVEGELYRQLDAFRGLAGKNPTHIDSHQNVHFAEPARSLVLEIAHQLAVPVRGCCPEIRYCGGFYGQTKKGLPYPDGITVDGLIRIISGLSPGFTELGCHPGEGDDLDTMYRAERAEEVKVLCDPRIRVAIEDGGIRLCSFVDLAVPSGMRTKRGGHDGEDGGRPTEGTMAAG